MEAIIEKIFNVARQYGLFQMWRTVQKRNLLWDTGAEHFSGFDWTRHHGGENRMTELERLTEDFATANANFDREDKAALELREQIDLLPMNTSAGDYARLRDELELQKRRVAESARLMREARSRLDAVREVVSADEQREANARNLEIMRKELNEASAALVAKQEIA
jgi:hypothetical protein